MLSPYRVQKKTLGFFGECVRFSVWVFLWKTVGFFINKKTLPVGGRTSFTAPHAQLLTKKSLLLNRFLSSGQLEFLGTKY